MIRQAVILAGGEGTRLRPVTLEIPKPLVPVQGRSILAWQVEWFARYGVKDILVVIPSKWQKAFQAWQESFRTQNFERGMPRIELWIESEPMGTMGAITHHLAGRLAEDFFVSNGDELKGLDLEAFVEFHRAQSDTVPLHAATIGLVRVPNPSDYGVAEMQGARIVRFHEKPAIPPSTLISSGLYVLTQQALAVSDRTRKYLMFEKDLFPPLAEQGRLAGCALEGSWYDCGTMDRWEKAIREWKGSPE